MMSFCNGPRAVSYRRFMVQCISPLVDYKLNQVDSICCDVTFFEEKRRKKVECPFLMFFVLKSRRKRNHMQRVP